MIKLIITLQHPTLGKFVSDETELDNIAYNSIIDRASATDSAKVVHFPIGGRATYFQPGVIHNSVISITILSTS